MPSIESGRSDNPSSDRPAHQPVADSVRLDHESIDATCDPDKNYWDAPIHSRLAAAFHIGRLLNELDFHSQHVLFFRSPDDRKMVGEVLNRLVAVSYNLVKRPPNRLEAVIDYYRNNWIQWLKCDAVVDEVAECNYQYRQDFEIEVSRQDLVANRIWRPLNELRDRLSRELSESERWALDLGQCLDEGLRRSDVHRFFDYEISEDASSSREYLGETYFKIEQSLKSFTPGELEPDTAWPHKLEQLSAMTGIPFDQCGAILTGWKHGIAQDNTISTRHIIEKLDHCIREQLKDAGSSEPAAKNNHEEFTKIKSLPEAKKTESPLGSVGVDGQASVQQQPPVDKKEKSTIPEEYLSRILTKKEAAEIHCGHEVANPTEYIDSLVSSEMMCPPQGKGQKWRFDIRDFDRSIRGKLRRPPEESSAT